MPGLADELSITSEKFWFTDMMAEGCIRVSAAQDALVLSFMLTAYRGCRIKMGLQNQTIL